MQAPSLLNWSVHLPLSERHDRHEMLLPETLAEASNTRTIPLHVGALEQPT